MTSTSAPSSGPSCADSCGLGTMLRSFRIGLDPSKALLAAAGIVAVYCWGGMLDVIWRAAGRGTDGDAVVRWVGLTPKPPASAPPAGIFETLRAFEAACTLDAVESVRYGKLFGSIGAGEAQHLDPTRKHPTRGAFTNLLLMGRSVVWLVTQHYFFALLLLPGMIIIWGVFGGAICRIAAMQFSRDETITLKEALQFSWRNLWNGFAMAPALPLGLCLLVALFLMAGGLFLRIPWFGDLLGGLLFFLAMFGGLIIALALVGLVAGGSLFWPTIAVEGTDGFDAVSRSFSYVFGRPLRAAWYALIAVVVGSFAWLLIRFVAWLALSATHLLVGIGSGAWYHDPPTPNKLSALWKAPTFETLQAFPPGMWSGSERIGGGLVAIWVALFVAVIWALLISYYFSASTAAYLLLRRDVDGTDSADVRVEGEEGGEAPAAPAPAPTKEVSLPVVGGGGAPAGPTQKPA